MQTLNIDVKKIDKTALYAGKKGTYLNLVLHDNKQGEDEWGNMGFITQDIGKERRLAGEKGPILGNWKHIGGKPAEAQTPPGRPGGSGPMVPDEQDDIPF
jgi:hypothetical protein